MKREYRFKENKIARISGNIGFGIFLTGIVSCLVIFISSIFITKLDGIIGLGCFLISLPLAMVPLVISYLFSKRDDFTNAFIKEIKSELLEARTIQDLYKVNDKLLLEAVDESNMIRLSYPLDIKKLIDEIKYKIQILEKQ